MRLLIIAHFVKNPILFILFSVYLTAQPAQFEEPPVMFDPPLSPRIANYEIEARLDKENNLLHGKEILTWKNTSPGEISELRLHTYLNAFRNNRSTFMLEAGRRYRGVPGDRAEWGYLEIDRIMLLNGNFSDNQKKFRSHPAPGQRAFGGQDLSPAMEYIQPDTPEHVDDKTVLRIPLPRPLPSGDSLQLFIEFTAKLPEPPYARSGIKKEFVLAAQWFPKMAVYEVRGWNSHQFHTNSEFFADFGVYNVRITVPEEDIVGATGIRVGKPLQNGDGSATHFYHAEDVHDFAWTASPEYVEFKGRAQDVDIRVLTQPDHAAQGPRHVEAARVAVEYFQNWYGDYPYPNITIVDPRRGADETGGMEYPTFFTVGTFYGIPEGLRWPELVIIHEFGHNYWYGMVASNEFEETWLDEGICNYTEMQIMNDYYGPSGDMIDFMGVKINDRQYQRWDYISTPDLDPVIRNTWEYYSNRSYGISSYDKPAIMLATLQNYLGRKVMKEIIRTYFERWKFKHPRSRDFIAVANEVSQQDLTPFFEQALYSNAVLDYSVDMIFSRNYQAEQGYDFEYLTGETDSATSPELDDSLSAAAEIRIEEDTLATDSGKIAGEAELYENVVKIRRRGEFKFPVEVEMVFDNGEVIRETWDGHDAWKHYRYLKTSQIVSAAVDPDNKLVMDVNFTNNSKAIEKRPLGRNKLSLRWMFWMQFLMDQPEIFNLFTAPVGFN